MKKKLKAWKVIKNFNLMQNKIVSFALLLKLDFELIFSIIISLISTYEQLKWYLIFKGTEKKTIKLANLYAFYFCVDFNVNLKLQSIAL